jgi:FMN phosphatase YigB (HAD superfamily)
MTAPIAALLFDFGGTLDSDGIPWKERFSRALAAEGTVVSSEHFDRAFYRADDALVGRVPAGLGLAETASRLAHGLVLELGLDAPGLADRIAGRFETDSRAHLRRSAAILADLARTRRIAIVSNFYGNLEAVCADGGLLPHVAAAVDSSVVGFTKPDIRIFEAALGRLGVPADRAIFIGDSPGRDMAGAREAGLRHLLLAAEETEIRLCCPGDRAVRRLADVPRELS